MPAEVIYVVCALIGYFLGCFSTAYVISFIVKKKDIRKYGSGNAGASNVIRTFGYGMGLLTFVGDVSKGIVAVLIGRLLLGDLGGCIAGIAAICGHNWPVFLKFRGGKGMATSFGIVLVLEPILGVIMLVIAVIVMLLTGYFSAGSLIACIFTPIAWVLFFPYDPLRLTVLIIIGVMGIFSHRGNIQRILKGTERKTDFSKIKM